MVEVWPDDVVVSTGFVPEPAGLAVELAVQPEDVFFGFEWEDLEAGDFFVAVDFELEGLVPVGVLAGGID